MDPGCCRGTRSSWLLQAGPDKLKYFWKYQTLFSNCTNGEGLVRCWHLCEGFTRGVSQVVFGPHTHLLHLVLYRWWLQTLINNVLFSLCRASVVQWWLQVPDRNVTGGRNITKSWLNVAILPMAQLLVQDWQDRFLLGKGWCQVLFWLLPTWRRPTGARLNTYVTKKVN